MTIKIVVIGAGGFGREATDVIRAINSKSRIPKFVLVGVFDDSPSESNLRRLGARGIPYLGAIPDNASEENLNYVVGIGNPQMRRKVADRLDSLGWTSVTLIHPSSTIGSEVYLGSGSVVCGGVQISTNVRCGRHVHLNPNSVVGHDAVLHDFVSVNPAGVISGEVRISEEVLVGANATILQGLIVGRSSVVGASACVTKNVSDCTVVKGLPAK